MRNRFIRFILLTSLSTYLLIFLGGLVRVSGAGLGCPDWPFCFGCWIPPLNASQIPIQINPSCFNMTLAWIEYINRLFGVIVGILIFITFLWTLISYRQYWDMLLIGLGSVMVLLFQAWLGGVVVTSALKPWIVSLHFFSALILLALLIYLLIRAQYLQNPQPRLSIPEHGKWLLLFLGFLSIIQIVFGMHVREALEQLSAMSFLTQNNLLDGIGGIKYLHLVNGLLIMGLSSYIGIWGLRTLRRKRSQWLRYSLFFLMGIGIAQVMSGLSFGLFGLQPLGQLAHMLLASLYIIVLWLSFLLIHYPLQPFYFSFTKYKYPILLCIIFISGLMGSAQLVIRQAESSRQESLPRYGSIPPRISFMDHSGNTFSMLDWQEKWHLVNFFYTSCSQCAANQVNHKMQTLYTEFSRSNGIRFLSITVDPKVDNISILKDYANYYAIKDKRWLFLRGDWKDIVAFSKACHFPTQRLPEIHSFKFVLIDGYGMIRGFYDSRVEEEISCLKEHINRFVPR